MRYKAIPAGDLVIFLGRELRTVAAMQAQLVEAQRALDEDYNRLRQLETRYRVLFQTSSEPLLIVGASGPPGPARPTRRPAAHVRPRADATGRHSPRDALRRSGPAAPAPGA